MSGGTWTHTFWRRGAAVASGCIVCLCLAGCVALGGQSTGTTAAGAVRAGDAQNGKTITLHPGQVLIVTLSTTFWTFQGSSNIQALAPADAPVASPAPRDSCHYGGCTAVNGSVTATFHAVAPGAASVTASRVSCGEAMGCVGGAGQYQLTVEVTATSP